VLLLPATTRYESPGGGTETTTERRIVYSPEIRGRRIGSARPEWAAITEAAARAYPERGAQIRFEDAAAIRSEIARAIPLYAGIETLRAKGDQVQWGGRVLYADGQFATPDRKAHFVPVSLRGRALAPGSFYVSTRRGKQFNSMVQKEVDPLTGAGRDAVLMCGTDADALGLADGAPVRLRSASGCYDGRVMRAPMRPGNLEVHWPEGMTLLGATLDPESLEPDYNAVVEIESRT
jgi:predicted molibdopterin-dependent oxidoreductase YjgC